MLTKTDMRRLDICADRIADPNLTIDKLAAKYHVSDTSIQVAIKWGNEQGLFVVDSSRKLKEHTLRLTRICEHLQNEFVRALKKANEKPTKKNKYKDNAYYWQKNITRLAKSIMDYETRIMELENIYHKVHLHLHAGEVEHKHILGPELQKLFEQITGRKIEDGNGKLKNVTNSITDND